jgi:hypothetical protein
VQEQETSGRIVVQDEEVPQAITQLLRAAPGNLRFGPRDEVEGARRFVQPSRANMRVLFKRLEKPLRPEGVAPEDNRAEGRAQQTPRDRGGLFILRVRRTDVLLCRQELHELGVLLDRFGAELAE